MTTDSDKCSFSSLLPMSCRGRAEAFARRLHSRLRSLGSQDGSTTDENSWLGASENPIAVSQPRHSSDSDLYFDFTILDSPGSPEEEIPEPELARLITNNKDNLHIGNGGDCHCSKPRISSIPLNLNGQTISPDSDSSDGQYFDPETSNHVNGMLEDCNSFVKDKCLKHLLDPSSYSQTSEGSPLTLTISEEESTLDIQDEDFPSLEYITCSQEGQTGESSTSDLNDLMISCNDDILTNVEGNHLQTNSSQCTDIGRELTTDLSDIYLKNLCHEDFYENETVNSDIIEPDNYKLHSEEEDINSAEEKPKFIFTIIPNEFENNSDVSIESHHAADPTDYPNLKVEESYCSTFRIENNLTVNFNDTKLPECALINEVEVNTEADTDDVEDREEPIPRVRRCSSLKTGKTPPGTPGRKKIVRFADVLGLDLADVRTYLDEIPKIPNSAYNDLLNADLCSSLSDNLTYRNLNSSADKVLVSLFQQPGGQTDFLDRVRENQVCLENAVVDDPVALSVTGTVRVRNLDFNKSVHIRYSLDSWKSYSDLQAVYVHNSCDGFSDKFSFLLYANTLTVGQRLEFAVRFQCKGCQYWDSNNGANYCFQCLPASNQTPYTPITGPDDHWGATFY